MKSSIFFPMLDSLGCESFEKGIYIEPDTSHEVINQMELEREIEEAADKISNETLKILQEQLMSNEKK